MSYPNMTAFHTMILFSDGAPLTPAGGSSCSLHNKKIKRKKKCYSRTSKLYLNNTKLDLFSQTIVR